jgi:hypothetical protein
MSSNPPYPRTTQGRLAFFASSVGSAALLRGFSTDARILCWSQYGRRPILAQLKNAMEIPADMSAVKISTGTPHSFTSKRNGTAYPISVANMMNFQSDDTTPNLMTGR